MTKPGGVAGGTVGGGGASGIGAFDRTTMEISGTELVIVSTWKAEVVEERNSHSYVVNDGALLIWMVSHWSETETPAEFRQDKPWLLDTHKPQQCASKSANVLLEASHTAMLTMCVMSVPASEFPPLSTVGCGTGPHS